MKQKHVVLASMLALAAVANVPVEVAAAPKETKKKISAKQEPVRQAPQSAAAIDLNRIDTARLSELVFNRTNIERQRAGLRPFGPSGSLGRCATMHSSDMAQRDYFNHKSKGILKSTSPRQRATAQGFTTPMVAENIAMIPAYGTQVTRTVVENGRYRQIREADYRSYETLAEEAVVRWMDSPGHRRNILDPNLRVLGVGVALGYHDNVPYLYMTQNFGG